jgi:GAF domain-containing protein
LYLIFWQPLHTVTLLLVPLTMGFSILRYRLWDMAVIVNRTLVHGTLALLLALSYVIVGAAWQWALSGNIGMPVSPLAIILAIVVIIALYPLLRSRIQAAIDHRFYRDKVNLTRSVATFTREMRLTIELSELLRALVNRINMLLSTTYSAVFLKSGADFLLAEAEGTLPDAAKTLSYNAALYGPLHHGAAVSLTDAYPFPLIVPLMIQHADEKTLVGALAIGPRSSGAGFSSDELALTTDIVDQAGAAIQVGQLVKEKRHNDELLHSVIDLAVMFSAEKRFEQLLERILLEAKTLCNADGGTLYLYDDHDHLEFVIMHNDTLHIALGGTTSDPIPFAPLPFHDAVTGAPNHSNVAVHAALTRQTVNIPDAYHAEGFDFSGTKAFDQRTGYRSRSFLTVPLQSESGDLLGVLQLINARNPGTDTVIAFSVDLQRVVESLSTLAALALAAYIREQKLRNEIQELRIAVDQEKKERQVAQITESEYFQKLQVQAREFRARASR